MRITKKLVLGSAVAILALGLFGCNGASPFGASRPDLEAEAATASKDGTTGVLQGVAISVKNFGKDATNVEYDVVLCTEKGGTVSKLDPILYKGKVNAIAENAVANDTVSADKLSIPSTVADGSYPFGLIVDPDNSTGDSNANNNAKQGTGFVWVVNGKFVAGVIRGTLTIPAGVQWDTGSAMEAVPTILGYKIMCFPVPSDLSRITGPSISALPGYREYTVTHTASGESFSYVIGLKAWGSYYAVLFMDVNGNGTLNLVGGVSTGSPMEPLSVWPEGVSGPPAAIPISGDQTFKDLTMSSGH